MNGFLDERNNHLENVLAVISDKANLYRRNSVLGSAWVTVVSASDHYLGGNTITTKDQISEIDKFVTDKAKVNHSAKKAK